MQNLLQDLRYSARMLFRNPGYTLIGVLTLALGIGANTAVFSVVNALLLRPLPYPQAERLAYVWTSDERGNGEFSLSPPNYADLRTRIQSFDGQFAFRYANFALTGDGLPEAVIGIQASADFGRVIGTPPLYGRYFTAEEDAPGRHRVVLLSYGLWQRRFGGNPQVVGQSIQLNGEAQTVIGVMPPEFAFPSQNIEVWTPLALDPAKYQRGTSFLQSVARLKPGATITQAQAEAQSLAHEIVRENSATVRDLGFKLVSLRKQVMGEIEKPLWILFGAVGLVLLIACVNVASLLLGRATVRWREISVRAALGASRWRLMRLMLIESLLLGLTGGLGGLLLAGFGIDWLLRVQPDAIPHKAVSPDGYVVVFTLVTAVLTGLIFGLIPAWQISKTNLSQVMRESGRAASSSGRLKMIRSGLVVLEISLSLVLLVSTGLLLRSFWKLVQVNPGFQAENVVSCSISLPRARYADEWQQAEFFNRTLDIVRAQPGVEVAAVVTHLPFTNSRGMTTFEIDGRPTPPGSEGPGADNHEISPGYFAAMGIPLQAGRDFTDQDDRDHPGVVIINEQAARRYWPGENPVGKRLTIGSPPEEKLYGKPVSREIVGIIGNVRLLELNAGFEPEVYVPMKQMPSAGMSLVVRGRGAADSFINGMREAVRTVDPNQPVRRAQPIAAAIARSVAPQRFMVLLLVIFAALAVVLAVVGIYGVMNYTVTQRTQEIGIRLSLGAQPSDVLRLIIGQGLRLVAGGLLLGLAGAVGLSQVLRSLLFEISATDPLTFAAVVLLLVLVALLACWLPARRAARVDPMIVLRQE